MARFASALLAVPLALAACSKEPEVKAENASIAEVAAAARTATKIEPGKWRTEASVESFDMPGAPPQMAEAIKQQMAQRGTQTAEACVTKEQAERPPEELLAGSGADACRYETFEMKDGKLNAVMTCKGNGAPAGGMRMTVAGDYGGSSYDLASTMTIEMGQKATVKTRVKGTRIGDCAS